MATEGEGLAIILSIAALVVAIIAIPLAWFFSWWYYKKSSKETSVLKHDLEIVKSHGLAIIEQNQTDDPKSVEIVEKEDKRLARVHRVSHAADAYLVRERPKYPVWHDDGTYAKE